MQSAQEWIGGCIGNGPHQGNDEEQCYGFSNCSCVQETCLPNSQGITYTCNPDSIGWDAP